jgi:hypothetical protein
MTENRPTFAAHSGPLGSDQVLAQVQEMLKPLVQWLISQGVGYPQMAVALREVFLDVAADSLDAQGKRLTDAAISLRSGVHRKEVRTYNAQRSGRLGTTEKTPQSSVAELVFTRWLTDAAYRNAQGQPAALPLAGPAPSFDSLVSAVTKDFARGTVLDELIRLGLTTIAEGVVHPRALSTVSQDQAQLLQTFSDHVADHIAACAHNLTLARQNPDASDHSPGVLPHLENSMYAKGLSDASIAQLASLAREVWKPAFQQMVSAAQQRYSLDSQSATESSTTPRGRMRFGVYFYSEPDQ